MRCHRMGTMWQPRRPLPSHTEGFSFSDASKPFLRITVFRSTSLLLCMAQVASQDLRDYCEADQIASESCIISDSKCITTPKGRGVRSLQYACRRKRGSGKRKKRGSPLQERQLVPLSPDLTHWLMTHRQSVAAGHPPASTGC